MTLEERVCRVIDQSKDVISAEGLAEVCRYRDYDEIEIAFEGLLIELAEAGTKPPGFDYDEWAQLLNDLGLREESVLLNDLWGVFQKWAKSAD